MPSLRSFFDSAVMRLLEHPVADRIAGYIAWQRRRKTRRRVEDALRAADRYPNAVQSGPFIGMLLPPPPAFIDARFEKTFGAYEHELFPVVQSLAAQPHAFASIINVGAADGFYTVGLARLFPDARLIAYEPNTVKTPVLLEMADLNRVRHRIELHGACTPEILRDLAPSGPSLVIVDVDGYEKEVLDPSRVPWLGQATLLIETHDCLVAGVTALLKERFAATHRITETSMSGPDLGTIPALAGLTMHQIDALVGSERPGLQTWLLLQPHQP